MSIDDLVKGGKNKIVQDPKLYAGFKKAFEAGAAVMKKAVARRAKEIEGLRRIKTRFYWNSNYNPSRISYVYSPNKFKDYSFLEPNISNILFL